MVLTKSASTVDATKAALAEIAGLNTKPFTEEELKRAKDNILNSFLFRYDTRDKVLAESERLEFYGYPAGLSRDLQGRPRKGDAGRLTAVAKKYIHPDKLAVLVVGNGPEIKPGLDEINSAMKLFIRARDNRNFEIVRGSLKRPRGEVIKQLAASHQLPENPYDAGKLLPIEWETTSISPEQFNELHSSFTSALAKLVEDAQSRSRDVLMTGGRISFHNTQYQIDYSNDGYESFEAIVDDVPTNNGHSDPLVAWVHQLLTFNPKTSVIR
jgi:hypothetical protein